MLCCVEIAARRDIHQWVLQAQGSSKEFVSRTMPGKACCCSASLSRCRLPTFLKPRRVGPPARNQGRKYWKAVARSLGRSRDLQTHERVHGRNTDRAGLCSCVVLAATAAFLQPFLSKQCNPALGLLMCHIRAICLVTHAFFSLFISARGPVLSSHMPLASFQHLIEAAMENLELN